MRPGVDVISRAQPLPRSAPTDVGTAFMVGATEKGPAAGLARSLTEYESLFGVRQGFAIPNDCADAYFREGGARLYVAPSNASLGRAAGKKGGKAEGEAPAQLTTTDGLDALSKGYGPGQVFIADASATDPVMQAALLQHAADTNRVALLQAADGDAAALTAAAAALSDDPNARYGAMFAPSAVIPGLTAGTTRPVPYPAVQAGMIGRAAATSNANVAVAGDAGQCAYVIDLAQVYTDADYAALNVAGVDMARLVYGGPRTYGYRTLVDPDGPDSQWLQFTNARLNMQIVALAEAIGEHYVFAQLDGRGRTVAQFAADLRAMLVPFYDAGALYGETPQDAFNVNVGAAVNTPETIANGELHAVIQVRMSPFSEWVVIEIVKVATTQALAA